MPVKCEKCGDEMRVCNRRDGKGQFLGCKNRQCNNMRNVASHDDVVDAINKLTKRMDRLGSLMNYIARSVEVRNKVEGVSVMVPFPDPMPPVEVDLPKTPPKVDVSGEGFPEDAPFDGGTSF